LSSRCLGYCDANQHWGQHDAQNIQPALVIRRGARLARRAPLARSSHMSLITGAALPPHRRRRGPPRPGERPAIRQGCEHRRPCDEQDLVPDAAHGYLPFSRKPLRGAVNGMTWPPCSIGSGSQIVPVIKSIHILRGGVRSRTTPASFPCSFSLIWRAMPCAPQSPVWL
jgi:hypothetical protein